MITSGDWSGTLVAMTLIAADVLLHMAGKPAGPYDEAVPIIVTAFVVGHLINKATKDAVNGKPPHNVS